MTAIGLPQRFARPVLFLVIVLGSFFFHRSALKNDFIADDQPLIVEGKLLDSWSTVPDIFLHSMWYNADLGELSKRATIDTYRPLPNFTFFLDHQIWGAGTGARGYHVTNVLIHSLCAGLFFAIASYFASLAVAFFVATTFAMHPQAVECAHYISARTDSLAALMVLLSLLCLVRNRAGSRWAWAASGCFYFLGLLSKEVVLTYGACVCLLAYSWGPEDTKRRVRAAFISIFVPTCLFFLLRGQFLNSSSVVLDFNHVQEVLVNHFNYTIQFLWSAVFPIPSTPSEPFEILRVPMDVTSWIFPIVSLLCCGLLVVAVLRKRSLGASFLIWSLLSLFPPLVAITVTGLHGPRYFYTPLIAGGFALALGIQTLGPRLSPPSKMIFGVIWVLAVGASGFLSMPAYRDNVTYYRALSVDQPQLRLAHYNLGRALGLRGNWPEAAEEFRRALEIKENDPATLNNLAVALLNQGKLHEALSVSTTLIERVPGNVRYLFNHGVILFGLRKTSDATRVFESALDLDPQYLPLRTWLLTQCERSNFSPTLCNRVSTPSNGGRRGSP